MSLYSKRFSGIEIQNDGKVLLIRKKNNNLISYIDTLSNEFNMKGNIKTNSLISCRDYLKQVFKY